MEEEKIAVGETKKPAAEITPEEKLFRLIAAAGKEDAELQELLTRYAQPKRNPLTGILKDTGAEKIAASPIVRVAVLAFFGLVAFYFLSGIQVGRTFYISPSGRLGEVGIEHATDFFPKFFTEPQQNSVRGITLVPPQAAVVPAAGSAIPAAAAITVPAREVKPFRLVGISLDGQGRVAMVETGQEERAKFVRPGDIISGNVRVEEIKDYSIVLSSGIKKWEIS